MEKDTPSGFSGTPIISDIFLFMFVPFLFSLQFGTRSVAHDTPDATLHFFFFRPRRGETRGMRVRQQA